MSNSLGLEVGLDMESEIKLDTKSNSGGAVLEASYIEGDREMRKELVAELRKIEKFVQWCMGAHEPAVVWDLDRSGRTVAHMSRTARGYYLRLGDLMQPIRLKYTRSLCVELFWRSLEILDLVGVDLSMSAPEKRPYRWCVQSEAYVQVNGGPSSGELFAALVERIREAGSQPEFRNKLRRQRNDAQRNYISALAYNECLFEGRSRLLVVRLDLGYRREVAQETTPEQLQRDLNRFLGNQRHNRLFTHLMGFIIKVEEGPLRGLHTHVVLYFQDSETRNHENLGNLIGRYWEKQITLGRGTFFNCNRENYRYPGIGVFNHDDQAKRHNLRERVLGYLFKDDQHVAIKGKRVFRRGLMPVTVAQKLGRSSELVEAS